MSGESHGPTHWIAKLTVRPPRVAVLVEETSSWRQRAMHVIECLSRTWGGAAAIIVPISSGAIPSWFWPLLELFDPDYFSTYWGNWRERQLDDAGAYERDTNSFVKQLAEQHGETIEQAKRSLFTERQIREPLWEPALSPAVNERVRTRLSAYTSEHRISEHIFVADDEVRRPLTDVTKIVRLEGTSMNLLESDALDQRVRLILALRLGAVAPSFGEALRDRGTPLVRTTATLAELEPLIELGYRGRVTSTSWSFHRAMMGATGDPDPAWRHLDYTEHSPFGWSASGCQWYWPLTFVREEEPSPTIVAGDTFADFCLAYALDRLTGRAMWMPATPGETGDVADGMRRQAADYLTDMTQRTDVDALLTSSTLADDELKQALDEMRAARRGWTPRTDLVDVVTRPFAEEDARRVLLPNRLLDRQRTEERRVEPFIGDEMAGLMLTPTPSLGAATDPSAVQWHVDVLFYDRTANVASVLPPRPAMASIVARSHAFQKIRAGRDGTSYLSHSLGYISGSSRLDQRLATPQLRVPPALEVFEALAKARGMRVEVSAAGAFTSGTLELLGGLAPMVRTFTNPASGAILEAYGCARSPDVRADDDPVPGVFVHSLERRFLSADDIERLTKTDERSVRALLDEWAARGIIRRGILLKCRRCRFDGWFRAGEFTDSFTCARCRAISPVALITWRQPAREPTWRYELDEVVYQAVKANARAPVMALQALRARARAFISSPELYLFEGNTSTPFAELDIATVVDGRICVGEAKTVARLEDTAGGEREAIDKIIRAAEALTADDLVIATTERELRPTTRTMLVNAVRGAGMRLRILEGDALAAAARDG